MADLIWRAERACAAAWPAMREERVGDWIVRLSGGPTRRINSASPSCPDAALPPDDLTAIEAIYRTARQPVIVRIPSFAGAADAVLDRVSFAVAEDVTSTLHAAMPAITGGAQITPQGDETWLVTRARLAPQIDREAMLAMTRRIAGPAAFVRRDVDGAGAAVAYGAIAYGLLVIEAVATDPVHRRRGLARDCVATLMAWARARGTAEACLQVVAGNTAAIALYRGLGFTTHLYDYHYRRRSTR